MWGCSNGRLILSGGYSGFYLRGTEIFDSVTNTFTISKDIAFLNFIGLVTSGILDACVVTLSSGEIIMTGGGPRRIIVLPARGVLFSF